MSVGRAAFGTLKELTYQGDRVNLLTKKCNRKNCGVKKSERQNNCGISVQDQNIRANKTNIIAGLYYETNLKKACVISNNLTKECKTSINASPLYEYPFYWINKIDPYGELFGNSIYCGVNNYRFFLRFSPKDTNK